MKKTWLSIFKENLREPLYRRRLLFCSAGVGVLGIGVGFFGYSVLGMDPFQVFARGTGTLFPMSFGTYYMVLNFLLLIGVFFLNRKKIGLGTILNMLFLGYIAQFTEWLLRLLAPEPGLLLRIGALTLGILVNSFFASLYFVADMGVSTYDAIAITIDERTRIPFRWARIATDLGCVMIGYLLGGVVGVGTLASAFFMGPIISFFKEKAAQPLLNRGIES